MGRYRAPQAPAAPYITPLGYRRLVAEADQLWRRTRPAVTQALAAAAAEGDRSENAEYTYRKKQLAEIDRRLRYLRKRIAGAKVVRDKPRDRNQVYFAAQVTLRVGEQVVVYRIVGVDEIDPKQGAISIESPLAKALIQKRIGDEVAVDLPEGRQCYRIVEVDYDW